MICAASRDARVPFRVNLQLHLYHRIWGLRGCSLQETVTNTTTQSESNHRGFVSASFSFSVPLWQLDPQIRWLDLSKPFYLSFFLSFLLVPAELYCAVLLLGNTQLGQSFCNLSSCLEPMLTSHSKRQQSNSCLGGMYWHNKLRQGYNSQEFKHNKTHHHPSGAPTLPRPEANSKALDFWHATSSWPMLIKQSFLGVLLGTCASSVKICDIQIWPLWCVVK